MDLDIRLNPGVDGGLNGSRSRPPHHAPVVIAPEMKETFQIAA
jgi:hypothetical protein